MRLAVVAVALAVGCRGDHPKPATRIREDAAPTTQVGAASSRFGVPRLPPSADGSKELAVIDGEIARLRSDPLGQAQLIDLLLARAAVTQQLEDYVEAVERTGAWVADQPANPTAWSRRVQALSRVHRFADAAAALARLQPLTHDPSEWKGLAATLDEATGHPEAAQAYREASVSYGPDPMMATMLAANLGLRGKLDEAIAMVPGIAAQVHDNGPIGLAWLLFQWGRLYELAGKPALARELFAEAHARLPGYVEATVHLAAAMSATGQDPTKTIEAAMAAAPLPGAHPELLALAGRTADARLAWERYLAALPEAFSDHAARFFLGPGADPQRALTLARANLANRPTHEAQELVALAALAAGDPVVACSVADQLVLGLRAQQFTAWRALVACGRTADAEALAKTLGIR